MSEWEPWNWSPKWKSKADYYSWLRGQLRRSVWSNYFPKTEFKKNQKVKLTPKFRAELEERGLTFHPRTQSVGQCHYCKDWFKDADLEVDHSAQAGGLKNEADVGQWLINLQCHPDNLLLTCKPCHKIKSYAERMNYTFEKARTEKEVIAFAKLPLTQQLKRLQLLDVELTKQTKKECKEKYREYLNSKERK